MKKLLAIAPIVFLVACEAAVTPPPTTDPVLTPEQDTCSARQYFRLIGQDVTALERVMIIGEVRIIRPGDAVTMDYRADRINFNLDSNDKIESITCS